MLQRWQGLWSWRISGELRYERFGLLCNRNWCAWSRYGKRRRLLRLHNWRCHLRLSLRFCGYALSKLDDRRPKLPAIAVKRECGPYKSRNENADA